MSYTPCFALFVNQPIETHVVLSLLGNQIKENKIGKACETHGQEDKSGVRLESLKEKGRLQDIGVDGWVILQRI
jgi:hypothetical protein